MKKILLFILILLFLPNIALAQAQSQPNVRRIITEENDNQPVVQLASNQDKNSVVYGLAAVVLAIVAIFAFNSLINSKPRAIKKHDHKL